MAIVEMKRFTLLGMANERDKLLGVMQRAGCVQVSDIQEEAMQGYISKDHAMLDAADEKLARVRWAIGQLGRFEKKQGMLAQMSMPEASAEEANAVALDEARLLSMVARLEACERKNGELRGAQTRLKIEAEQLTPWLSLDIPVKRLHETRETVQFTGSLSVRSVEALESALADLPVRLRVISTVRDVAHIWIVAHKSAQDDVRNALKDTDFSSAQFFFSEGTPAEQMNRISEQSALIEADRRSMENELSEMAGDLPRLKVLHELVADEKARLIAASHFASTEKTYLLQGWVPEHACGKLEEKLRSASKSCAIEFRDATDDETPPTMMRNHRFVAPFESVVANYSWPDPKGLDPTFIMAPFFACFFGMMVSDAGYGLIMAIAIPLIIHFLKPKTGLRKIMWVLAIGGAFTVFWGAMFDTWFGESVHPMLINTLEEPLSMMALCMGAGVIHLFVGLGVAAYMNIKRGKPLDAVFDQFLWIALVMGLPMMLLPQTSTIGMILAIVGAVGIVLTAGRNKPTILGKITGGLGALYGITSWLSDILSYMRLFGMGLATGVIGMVINMLARMVLSKGILGIVFGVLVLIVGHVFNASINVLGAYVHACRLQYIEFFGKFYEDGGVPFTPLASTPRYIAIRDGDMEGVKPYK